MYHGLKPLGKGGILKIQGKAYNNKYIEFIISDNGVGIEEERLEEINNNLKSNTYHMKDHIGIFNVNQRIKIIFGKEYGICFTSKKNIGTSVKIKIPIVKLH